MSASSTATQLHDYGILNEQSDYRIHVCPLAGKIYSYPTASGIDACLSGKHQKRSATQPGVSYATAEGFCVPIDSIPDIRCVSIPDSYLDRWFANVSRESTTTHKGNMAARLVARMLQTGTLPLPLYGKLVSNMRLQLDGVDILVDCRLRLQVKCDWRGGVGSNCTGNLFLQTAECNPHKLV